MPYTTYIDLNWAPMLMVMDASHRSYLNHDKWFKDILPDKDPYHNRGRDQMRKNGGPEFECLWPYVQRHGLNKICDLHP
jgi:hypothetical protein